ncbi:Alpha/Beta hydrolase protein [Penicillium maclennaniae]|uniref:Alpha/Beta hydrolase protein n=1 Tax=Penicillium maclennaniae TaxID=1343394 RepID=UPI00254164B7|nr:Alpha/Beta hydrolase protein [Penicillium maclennaniae]KAJ5670149.1 Alpha/Beta hydrolase protein [Penicillium maclennaniae]
MKAFTLWAGIFGLAAAGNPLTVQTETGVFTGLQNADYSGVREFRNIPFARPPVGELRFMPPQRLPKSTKHYFSTRFPPPCPQFVSNKPSFFNLFTPFLEANNGNQNHSTGFSLQTGSEDCLSLAIWTPYGVSPNTKLPVIFFMTGGGFNTGGIDEPGQIPAPWVNRTQEHIVVTINYRVNIFGYPNAAGLENPNPALLDQRMALEWVHENIGNFGGKPRSHYHVGTICRFSQSGTAVKSMTSTDFAQSNFTFVAKNLGCDFPNDSTAELRCMQQVSMNQIENFIGQYSGSQSLTFGPIVDNVYLFSDYQARAAAGKISPRPAIFSDAANNNANLVTWPSSNVSAGPYQPAVDAGTLKDWVCPTANTSLIRAAANLTTYRYQYAGQWANQNPYKWLGAYHSSDLVMNFRTYYYNVTNATVGPSKAEAKTSQVMQDHILAFMKDPLNGPPAIGWNPYHYGGNVLRFGAEGIPMKNVSGYEIDGPCFGNGTYNPFP